MSEGAGFVRSLVNAVSDLRQWALFLTSGKVEGPGFIRVCAQLGSIRETHGSHSRESLGLFGS